MSLAKAREHLAKYGLEGKIMEFSTSSASVVEAANAIGCKEREIVKNAFLYARRESHTYRSCRGL